VPRPDEQRGAKLNAIGGRPPILIDLPPGCAFAPRCPKAQPRCRQETPPLMDVGPNQKAACFYPY
jgi:oligopeptide/dipeptide ABC transporter ATP-binding protein